MNRRIFRTVVASLLALLSFPLWLLSGSNVNGQEAATREARPGTVLITGANRGLGYEFARQYAAAGWKVIGTARDPEEAAELKAVERVRVEQLDVADGASVDALAKRLDGVAIDLLINNAGISGRGRSLETLDVDEVARVLDVNVLGPMRVTKALLPNLRAGEGKTIVGISSGLGSVAGNTNGGYHGYRESKASLNMFTRSVAAELKGEGFIAIAMSPGWVKTDMGGENASLEPEVSIAGMRKVIAGLTPEQSGGFWSWDGKQVPW